MSRDIPLQQQSRRVQRRFWEYPTKGDPSQRPRITLGENEAVTRALSMSTLLSCLELP